MTERTPKSRTPRRRDTDAEIDGWLGKLQMFLKSLGNPSDIKSTVAFVLAIATALLAVLNLKGDVQELRPIVIEIQADLETADARLDRQETKLKRLESDSNALAEIRKELNDSIRKAIDKAVEDGIRRGVRQALAEMKRR